MSAPVTSPPVLQGGSLLQNQQQNEINADMQLFNEQANGGWDLLNRYYGVIGNGNWGGNQTMTTPDQTGNQLLQAGAQLGAAYLLASDRRLKTDLQPVGKTRVTDPLSLALERCSQTDRRGWLPDRGLYRAGGTATLPAACHDTERFTWRLITRD